MKSKRGWILLLLGVLLTAGMITGGILFSSRWKKAPVEVGIQKYLDAVLAEDTAASGDSFLRHALISNISYDVLQDFPREEYARVEFTYVDMEELQFGVDAAYPEDEFFLTCIERIKTGTAPLRTETIDILYDAAYEQSVRCCVVVDSFELANILCGGTLDTMLQALEEVLSA